MNPYQEPSKAHLDAKIIGWLIGCVLLGIVLAVIFPDFEDEWMNRARRSLQGLAKMQTRIQNTVKQKTRNSSI
jgi:hypothetical protein